MDGPHDLPETDDPIRSHVERFLSDHSTGGAASIDAFCDGVPAQWRDAVRRECLDAIRVRRALEPSTPDDDEDLPLEAGQVLGDFLLVREIGAGAMGRVWEAQQVSLERRVALKVLNRRTAETVRGRKRFEREARAAAKIDHPNIVSVFGKGEASGHAYIAMKLVPGRRTLHTFLWEAAERDQVGPGYYTQVAELVGKVARAIEVLHGKGILHRDLKPGNILLAEGDEPMVADFGLAKLEGATQISLSGEFVGTLRYSSPEQLKGRKQGLDKRADVFSLGTVLYELVTRRPAFPGSDHDEVIHQILHGSPQSTKGIDPGVPDALLHVALKALRTEPRLRYASMAEFAEDLDRYLRGEPVHARAPSVALRVWRSIRRHRIRVAAAALIVVAAFSLFLLLDAESALLTAKKGELRTRLTLDIERGDLDAAARVAREYRELDRSDPIPHISLAFGYGRHGLFPEMRKQLELADAAGYPSSATSFDPARRKLLGGLSCMVTGDAEEYARAESLLAEAIELDPGLEDAYFPLYQLRQMLGDQAAAAAVLEKYRERLAPGDLFTQFVGALLHEARGDYQTACTALEEVHARKPEDEKIGPSLRVERYLGRCYLQLRDTPNAQRWLQVAVGGSPNDGASWINLASAFLLEYVETSADTLPAEPLSKAIEAAKKAAEALPHSIEAHQLIAEIHVYRFITRSKMESMPDEGLRAEARDAIESLRRLEPEPALLDFLSAEIRYVDACSAMDVGRFDDAIAGFDRCSELNPSEMRTYLYQGQIYQHLKQYSKARQVLSRSLELWDQPVDSIYGHLSLSLLPVSRKRWEYHALLSWLVGAAAMDGDRTGFADAVQRMEAELDRQPPPGRWELVNLAEHLLLSPDEELRNCPLALRVLEEFDLEHRFDDAHPNQKQHVDNVIAAVRAQCD